jgi:hypothetical protein
MRKKYPIHKSESMAAVYGGDDEVTYFDKDKHG